MRVPVLLVVFLSLCACADEPSYNPEVPQGDPQRGRVALVQFDCGVCHVIPGVTGARGMVGPPLGTRGLEWIGSNSDYSPADIPEEMWFPLGLSSVHHEKISTALRNAMEHLSPVYA